MEISGKYNRLLDILSGYGSAAIAFSGGVDSTFLLYAARDALGKDKIVAVTSQSALFPEREFKEAEDFCRSLGVRHLIIKSDELANPGFRANPKDRCYVCKKDLFQGFLRTAAEENMAVVAEGSNIDDEGDYRPGLRAIAELGIKSPLREAGLTKEEIRQLSKQFDLPTWDKPSFACLASRIPYGEEVTKEKLSRIEKAEQVLLDLGFKQFRVRHHGTTTPIARIELIPNDIARFISLDIRQKVNSELRNIGFYYITLDIQGYRTGSLDETNIIFPGNKSFR